MADPIDVPPVPPVPKPSKKKPPNPYKDPRGGARAGNGGKRPGAGRKPGDRGLRGMILDDYARKAKRRGLLMPLEYMLGVMRNPDEPKELRADMAKAAAGYFYPKLNAVTVAGDPKKPIKHKVQVRKYDDLIARYQRPKPKAPA